MKDLIYVAKIVHSTSVDGVGLRNSLYVSGCDIHCKGCHNSQLWELRSGKPMSIREVLNQLNEDDFDISILGGEPLMQYEAILQLCKVIKKETHKSIWLWSGHKYEEIKVKYPEILEYIDVLVDGPFIESKKEPNLKWRGSNNQRVLLINSKSEL